MHLGLGLAMEHRMLPSLSSLPTTTITPTSAAIHGRASARQTNEKEEKCECQASKVGVAHGDRHHEGYEAEWPELCGVQAVGLLMNFVLTFAHPSPEQDEDQVRQSLSLQDVRQERFGRHMSRRCVQLNGICLAN